eukprot:5463468-Pyramimonas_sp.AAC.1
MGEALVIQQDGSVNQNSVLTLFLDCLQEKQLKFNEVAGALFQSSHEAAIHTDTYDPVQFEKSRGEHRRMLE